MASQRVADAPKGPNLYRAAQDAVLLLLCRDPLAGQTYREIEEGIAHDRETMLHGFDDMVAAQKRLAENGSIVRDVKRVYARLRRDIALADHVHWLRDRPELRAMVETFADKLVDGDALPDRA